MISLFVRGITGWRMRAANTRGVRKVAVDFYLALSRVRGGSRA